MMRIVRELNSTEKKYIRDLASLHSRAFPNFFLTQLGEPFLRILYNGYLDDKQSGIIVAEEDNRIIGFIAYSNDYPGFYKGLLKRKVIQFATCSIVAAAKHPSFIKRLLGAFKKSDSVVKTERYVELASICVDPQIERKGVGSELINYLKGIVDFKSYSFIISIRCPHLHIKAVFATTSKTLYFGSLSKEYIFTTISFSSFIISK